MKKIGKISVFALSAALLMSCAACGETPPIEENTPETPEVNYTDPDRGLETYDNRSYNEYLLGEEAKIANQWTGYGIGDPFVMRWNGRYYLYCSSLDSEYGVRGYTSADLVNWAPMTGEGLKEGYVSEDNITLAAYAPEVYYFNGTFYMYTSPAGAGHYILTASSPEGPFVRATANFGLSIDGSVLIDDDEQMYFTFAGDSGIRMAKMSDMLTVTAASTPTLNNTSIGGWTEGSYILKKDGVYFLTYTGNHVASDGYRIAYSTADSILNDAGNIDRNAFTRAQNNPLALETESELKGIGHSSTVLGPDMDSYYLVYHYLNSSGGPNRSLGIDRLTFSGKMMSVAPTLQNSVKPALPAFYAEGKDESKFSQSGDLLLSNASTKESFTAEYNFTAPKAELVFGYTDENNYFSLTADFAQKSLKLNKIAGGTASELQSAVLEHDFDGTKLHTVRIAVGGGKANVVFDNMTKIAGAELSLTGGKIGYKSLAEGIGYTAFSDVSMGMSDRREPKQATGYVGAADFLDGAVYAPENKLGGSVLSTVTADEDVKLEGWRSLKLGAEGDYASYLVYAGKAGRYGLELVYRASDAGKKIGVKVDGVKGGTVYRCTLPAAAEAEGYVQALVGEFELGAGAHVIRLENVGSEVAFAAFRFTEVSASSPVFEHSLESYAEKGADYKTIWKLKEGGHYAKAGTRQLVYFGDATITDFTLEAEIMLEGATGTSTAGFVFRAQNYAASSHDSYRSIQGYYLAINNNMVALEKLNYADGSSDVAQYVDVNDPVESGQFHTVKIVARGNTFTVSMDGKELFTGHDGWGFSNGRIGLYTNGAAVIFKNLKISG